MPNHPGYPAPMRSRALVALFAWSALATLATTATAQQPAPASPKRPPNIVFVLADDLGYRELGSFGQQRIRTPHLDQLAADGMRLLRHYSGSPVCAPSRAVLMTGKHPGHATIRDNKEAQPEGQHPLAADDTTVAELLRAAGYQTGAFGKWGLGPFGSTGDPRTRGFARFYGYNCQRHAHSYYPAYLYDDAERVPLQNDPPVPGHGKLRADEDPLDPRSYARFSGRDYAPDRIQKAALAFVRANRDRPFFLYLPNVIPHLALHVPDAELEPYRDAWPETPYAGGNGYTPHRTPRAAYAAMITRLDLEVGELLQLLDELGLRQDTLVVFSSDNGATHSPVGGTDVDFFASCGELRGRKGSMYEGGIRVPTIVRWPGVVPAGSSSEFVSGFEDWLPTLLEATGATPAAGGDGVSLLPELRGSKLPPRAFLYREFAGYGGWQATWVGRHKLVRKNLHKQPVTELYDLQADPGEQHDLLAAQPEVAKALQQVLDREHQRSELFLLRAIDRP